MGLQTPATPVSISNLIVVLIVAAGLGVPCVDVLAKGHGGHGGRPSGHASHSGSGRGGTRHAQAKQEHGAGGDLWAPVTGQHSRWLCL
jgi:hypothetical protein